MEAVINSELVLSLFYKGFKTMDLTGFSQLGFFRCNTISVMQLF